MGTASRLVTEPQAPTWLVVAAGPWGPRCRGATGTLQLPNLQHLLRLMKADPQPVAVCGPDSLTLPHETAASTLLGLPQPPGSVPWAALALAGRLPPGMSPAAVPDLDVRSGAWAWVLPCHWQTGTHDVHLDPPEALQLEPAASRALMDAMAPYFAEDGLQLHWVAPHAWLASGEALRDVRLASLDRVVGESLQAWLPKAFPSPMLRRLASEMQMLLYAHPVNEARLARGEWPVNSFWISGAGALPDPTPAAPSALHWFDALRLAALRDDAASWCDTWRDLDQGPIGEWRQQLETASAPAGARLVLCGARQALSWRVPPQHWWSGLQRRVIHWRTPDIQTLLETL